MRGFSRKFGYAHQDYVQKCQTEINQNRQIYVALTYSMVHSPSWEANWFAASQEIPRILWNPKVHYRINKLPFATQVFTGIN